MEGQLNIFDMEQPRSKCEKCARYNMELEQPPAGWEQMGWCHNHNCKVSAISYCQEWEKR